MVVNASVACSSSDWETLFLLNYIVPKDESNFGHRSGLVLVHARGTEGVSRREAVRTNPRKVSSNEEAPSLEGGRQSYRRTRAARTEYQVDSVLSRAPCARDVLPAPGEREAATERATQQYRTTVSRRSLRDPNLQVGRYVGVLPIGLDDPGPFRVGVNHVVNTAVVLHWCGCGLIGCLPIVSTRNEGQAMGTIGIC